MKNCFLHTGRSCAIAAVLALAGCSAEQAAPPATVKHVKVYVVGKETQAELRRISGRVTAADESQLSFGVSGTIASLAVNVGDEFAQGQLLASLDDAPLQLAVEQARAMVAVSRSKNVEAEQAYRRIRELAAKGVASQAELEGATAALDSARGNLRSEEASLASRERDLAMARITAPFAGQVADRLADPFEEVSASQAVLAVQTNGLFEVEVTLPETLMRLIDYGQVVTVSFPSAQEVVEGVVTEIGAQAGASSAYPVKVRLSSAIEGLRAGMTASVAFTLAQQAQAQPVYLIPLSAIAIDAGTGDRDEAQTAPVFVVGDDQRLQVRRVSIGDVRGNELEVFDGLAKGDQLVVAGVPFLREGMQVAVWQGSLADG